MCHACSEYNSPLFLVDAEKKPHRYCFVVYYVPKNLKIKVAPHGNSKGDRPFFSTLPSTMNIIKGKCSDSGPKEVVGGVCSKIGGVLEASDVCELPRDEQQISQAKRRMKHKSNLSTYGVSYKNDEISVIMQKAFMEDTSKLFIREVKTLREPAIIVAYDRQLHDLVRFCTNPHEFGILTVDPTFSLGDFDVTLISYQHLLLLCRRTHRSPIFIGPIMVHYKKTFSSYLFFASSLVGLHQELASIKCFGTDGEKPLYDAFQQAFPSSVHLLCSIHMRRNIKAKTSELGISQKVTNMILNDIFGKQIGHEFYEGLVDVPSDKEYEMGVKQLYSKWKALDSTVNGPVGAFILWFSRYKQDLIKATMLKSSRMKAGLGNPPAAFTNNASESLNALLKRKLDYKRHELPEFLDKLKECIEDQEKEVERAVVSRGKYVFRDDFKHLQLSEQQWSKMSATQRANHLHRVQVITLETSEKVVTSVSKQKASSSKAQEGLQSGSDVAVPQPGCLSVDLDSFSDEVLTPLAVLKSIWKKAKDLLAKSNSICPAPGGKLDCMVESYSGTHPHLVSAKKSGQFACDANCANWKSLNICSHSVAAAEFRSSLPSFIAWFKKKKSKPNLTQLVTSQMPLGRGRKGGKLPPCKKKKLDVISRTSFKVTQGTTSESDDSMDCEPALVDSAVNPHQMNPLVSPTLVATPRSSREVISCQSPTIVQNPGRCVVAQVVGNPHQKYSVVNSRTSPVVNSGTSSMANPQAVNLPSQSPLEQILSQTPCSTQSLSTIRTTMPSSASPIVQFLRSNVSQSPALTSCHVTGGVDNSSSTVNISLPPVVSDSSSAPFTLTFIVGNIRVCRGCRQNFIKPASPPQDLCIRHQEWVEFSLPGSSSPQTRFGNVYYHCNIPCVQARCPYFRPHMINVPAVTSSKLSPVHREYLSNLKL